MRQIKIIGLVLLLFVCVFPYRDHQADSGNLFIATRHHTPPNAISSEPTSAFLVPNRDIIGRESVETLLPVMASATTQTSSITNLIRDKKNKVTPVIDLSKISFGSLQPKTVFPGNLNNANTIFSSPYFPKAVTVVVAILLLLLFFNKRRVIRPERYLFLLFLLFVFAGNVNAQTPNPAIPGNITSIYNGSMQSGSATVGAGEVVVWYTDETGSTETSAPSGINAGTYTTYAAAKNIASGEFSSSRTLVNFTITKRTATWITNPNSKTYGSADPAPLTTGSGNFVASDNITATYTRAGGEPVGTYHITATLAPSAALGNYTITNDGADFIIGKKPALVTPSAATKTYGNADPVMTGALTGFVAADAVTATYSRTSGETTSGSPYTISAVLSPAVILGNYDITYNTANFTITKRTATWITNPNSKTYGSADPTPLTTGSGNFVATDNITATYTRVAGDDVGTYHITATLSPSAALGNYTITNDGADFMIGKKPASVTPAAATKTYGNADPVMTGALTGFVAADAVTAIYSRIPGEEVSGSPYTISAVLNPAVRLGNYDITYNTANFTITKRTATWTTDPNSKTYGSADPAPLTTGSGNFVAADNITATYNRVPGEGVGTYHITAMLAPSATLDNYTITNDGADFTIKAKTLSPIIIANNKCFDGNAIATLSNQSVNGVIGSDVILLNVPSSSFNNATVGSGKTVTAYGLSLGGADAGNYILSSATATTIADIYPIPLMTSASTATVCSSFALSLTLTSSDVASTYTWIGTDNPNVTGESLTTQTGGTISNALVNTSNSLQTVTYAVTPTLVDGLCVGSTQMIIITVSPKPAINNFTIAICSDGSFMVTPVNSTDGIVPAGTTYSWSAPAVTGGITGGAAGTGLVNISGTLINPTNTTQTATYTVTPTSGSCTGSAFTITVTVNPKPAITAMTTTICNNGSFTLTPINLTNGLVPAGTTYSWLAPAVTGGITGGAAGTGLVNISGTLINPTNTTQTATYTVTPTSGSCTGSTFTVTVTVSPTPAVTAMTTTICSSASFTVIPVNATNGLVPAGTTYTWAVPSVTGGITGGATGSGSANISGTLINPTNSAQTASYTVTATSGSCIGSIFTVTVTVNPKPTVTAITATICSEGSFTVIPANTTNGLVPAGTTYSWPAPSGTGFAGGAVSSGTPVSIGGTLVNTTNSAVTATYTVTPTSGSCTGSTFTVTVTISPKPALTAMTATICSGGSFSVTPVNATNGLVPAGTTYSWSPPAVTGGITGGAAGTGLVNISGMLINPTNTTQTATYSVTPISGSCTGSTFTVTVTVSPKPVPTITGSSPVCEQSTGNVYTTEVGMTNYLWIVMGGTVTSGGTTTSNTITIKWGVTGTGHVSVNYTNSNGCTAASSTDHPVLITPLPLPSISGVTALCSGSTGNIYTTETGMTNYTWTISGGTITSGGTSTDHTSTVTWTTSGNRTISVNYQNSFGCSAATPKVYTVTVNPTPNQPTPVGETICSGGVAILSASGAITGQMYNWYDAAVGGTLIKPSTDNNDNTYTTGVLATTTSYWISIISLAGCEGARSKADVTVIIVDPGQINASDLIFCEGENPPAFINTVLASGNTEVPPEYQWESSPDNLTYTPITTNGTGATYDPGVLMVSTWFHRTARIYTGSNYCTVNSNPIKLSVYPVPLLTVSSNSPVCDQNPLTITAVATNSSANVIFTLHFSSGSYALHALPNPTDQTITVSSVAGTATAIFTLYPEVGKQTYTITALNDDTGLCSSGGKDITVKIFDIPSVVVLASCANAGGGILQMSGTLDNANFDASDQGIIMYQIDNNPWTTDNIIYNIAIGTHTIRGKNTANDDLCFVESNENIGAQSVQSEDYNICQGSTVPVGGGLKATSFCLSWLLDQHLFSEVCTDDASKVYYPATTTGSTYQNNGSQSRFAILLTFRPQANGEYTIKDAKEKPDGSISLYKYPFDPLNPLFNFVYLATDIYPIGTTVTGLDPETAYVLVLNSTSPSATTCSDPWVVRGEKLDVVESVAPVYWYTTETSTTNIGTGEIFNPVGVNGSGLTYPLVPGTYVFYAGCDVLGCRQPVQFIVNPIPVVTYQKDTICSGTTSNIILHSVTNQTPPVPIDPTKVIYEWIAVANPLVTGYSNGTGPVIAQTLSVVPFAICPTMTYNVRASVGGCWGSWSTVDILILDNTNHTAPAQPPPLTFSCLKDVPAPAIMTLTHSCLNVTATAVETNNGGTGCVLDPMIITRKWTLNDACDQTIVTQTITVLDNVAPTFTAPIDIEIFKNVSCAYNAFPLVTGDVNDENDNCSSGIEATYTDVETYPCQGSIIITRKWTLADNCGNTTSHDQIIKVTDNTPPTILTPLSSLDANLECSQVTELAEVLLLKPTAKDNCTPNPTIQLVSDVKTYEDPTCPNSYIRIRTWSFTDECNNTSNSFTQTIKVADTEPPTFSAFPSEEYMCVQNIIDATWDGIGDILEPRPDYHTFYKGTTSLDLAQATFTDNCTSDPADLILHWQIDFADGSVLTGSDQLSAYSSNIIFPGSELSDVTHTLTYWLEDECHNITPVEQRPTVKIIVLPRPNVTKTTI